MASGAPPWFWHGSPVTRLHPPACSPLPVDSGGDIELGLTEKSLLAFTNDVQRNLEFERARIGLLSPDMLISDVDPMPVLACSDLGIPAFVLGNFTWDWIHANLFPGRSSECSMISAAYSRATYLRLPMGPEYSPCAKTVDMPLLPGGPPGDAGRVRILTGSRPYTLLAFREMPMGGIPDTIGEFTVASMEKNVLGAKLCIPYQDMLNAGVSFSDLVAGADKVVCKAGYGILSQLLAEGRDAVVLSGRRFPEEPFLLQGWNSLRKGHILRTEVRQAFLKAFIHASGL
ncbi:MAG: hypothetical protein R6V62_00300 [Candidatus Fermentibacteraceae bacterium]